MSLAGIFWRSVGANSFLSFWALACYASSSAYMNWPLGSHFGVTYAIGDCQHLKDVGGRPRYLGCSNTIPHPTIPGFYASSTSDPVPPLAKMENEMDIDILIMPLHGDNANSGTDDGAIAPVNDFDHIPMDYGWNGQEGQEPDLGSISQQYCGCHHESSETEGEDKEDKEDAEQYEKLSKCR
ncbi:hypothetical protein B0H14DRAFT_2574786 [Mycena olivaceomarginata]|nr:hypothetical protein B0H14DRAFT_2574786 [Mycena olivaceomarginata]